ncbi:MAG: hypothetical protein ACREQA_16670 [Candidatus Binatia bacterium]
MVRNNLIKLRLKRRSTTAYAKTLRVIGQALEKLHIKGFVLERVGEKYLLRVESRTPVLKKSGMQILQNHSRMGQQRLRGRQVMRHVSAALKLQYTSEDISRLEHEGKARRRGLEEIPDKYSLSQILRAVGAHIDLQGAHLLKLSKRGDWITIRYETIRGGSNTERLTISSLSPLFVRMYLQRSEYAPHARSSVETARRRLAR